MGNTRVELYSTQWTEITTAGGSGDTVLFEAKRQPAVWRMGTTLPSENEFDGFSAAPNETLTITLPANTALYVRNEGQKKGWCFAEADSITLTITDLAGNAITDIFGYEITADAN